jgi:hypothetical protein
VSTVTPATCIEYDYSSLETTAVDQNLVPQSSPHLPLSDIPGPSTDWYPCLPPPPGAQQYSTVYYQSMDPLDPTLPPPQPKKLKATEAKTAASHPELIERDHSRLGAQTVAWVNREIPVCPVLAKRHNEQCSPSTTESSDLGFFSTPIPDKQDIQG